MASGATSSGPALRILDPAAGHDFSIPIKRIHDGDDVSFFLASRAYADIMTFIFQLNTSMIPRRQADAEQINVGNQVSTPHTSEAPYCSTTSSLAVLLTTLTSIIDEAPPDPGPRRFGNVSFRSWSGLVQERISDLLDQHLPDQVLAFKTASDITAKSELQAYLLGSFGSSQRLDYGTGHELSFLAFLGCLWKLGAFPEPEDGDQERGIVLGVIRPYLDLIRRLILTYTLEPAGSHGVWGLDDHSFLPYIFGSAHYSPPITTPADVATEGSVPGAPNPADVAKAVVVKREREQNMYFGAIGFINDVKKGPFWEHSPILYDISGVKAGWAKINKVRFVRPCHQRYAYKHHGLNVVQGMIKMYHAEVLSKFPVVQHFPFGSLFVWEADPNASTIQASVHTSSQPKAATPLSTAPTVRPQPALRDPLNHPTTTRNAAGAPVTTAPWVTKNTTTAPWKTTAAVPPAPSGSNQPTRAPWATSTPAPPSGDVVTTAPWARGRQAGAPNSNALTTSKDTQSPRGPPER